MKTNSRWSGGLGWVGVLGLALAAGGTVDGLVHAQALSRLDTRAPNPVTNAALQYWPAMHGLLGAASSEEGLRLEALLEVQAAKATECDIARAFLDKHSDKIDQMIAASEIRSCDWGVDDRAGPATLLPHLGMLRRASTAVLASGVAAMERGDRAQGARALSAALRMGGHARESGFLIGSLCSVSMFQAGEKVITGMLDTGAPDAESREMLRAALEWYPDEDPFGVRAGIEQERRAFVGWLRALGHEYRGGDAQRKEEIREDVASLISDDQADPNIRSLPDDFVRAAEGDGVEPILKLLDGAYARAVAAWNRPDGYEELERQAREIEAGALGPVAKAFFPNLTAIHRRDREQRAVLARLRDRLGG